MLLFNKRPWLLTILLAMAAAHSFAQIRAENVKDENDVSNFLDSWHFTKGRGDTVISFTWSNDPALARSADKEMLDRISSYNFKSWATVDLNHDSKKDFIFCGFLNREMKIMAFVSNASGYIRYLLSPPMIDVDMMPLMKLIGELGDQLVIGRADPYVMVDTMAYPIADRIILDTLSYRDGTFIDHDFGIQTFTIDSLRFRYHAGSKRFEIIMVKDAARLLIWEPARNGSQTLERNQYVMRDPFALQGLWRYVHSTPFTTYRKYYVPLNPVLDGKVWVTDVRFSNGKSVHIFDHMELAPPAMRVIYGLIEGLKNYKGWEFEKTL